MMAVLGVTMFVRADLPRPRLPIVRAKPRWSPCRSRAACSAAATSPTSWSSPRRCRSLVLAANTAFADFPTLASIVARDRYMPRQFANLGDKLAFSTASSRSASARRRWSSSFDGDQHRSDPALHDRRVPVVHALADQHGAGARCGSGSPAWIHSAAISAFGAVLTLIVLVIVTLTKTLEGAWIVIVLIPDPRRHLQAHAHPLRERGRPAR